MLVGLVTTETGGGHSKNAPFCVTVTGVVTVGWALNGVVLGCLLLALVTIRGSDVLVMASLDVTGATHELNGTSDSTESTLTIVGVEVLFD